MKPISLPRVALWLLAVVAFSSCLQAQSAGPGISVAPAQPVSPSVISFSDTLPGQPDGSITVTFALYPDQQSLNAAWTETQAVQVTQNKYTVLLGSSTPDGIPPGVFAADQARWLGVQVNGAEKRYLLVSVPYAMKAVEAERLGGLLPSDFVTTQQLQTILLNSATPGGVVGKSGTPQTVAGPTQAASTNPPQPATDFIDNNASEVLLVTQQGTGFAIHAVSAGDAALFAENSTATGTALKAVAKGTTGANVGILGQSASATGIAGVFDNTGNGQILSLRNNGNEVASVDNAGDFRASQIQAFNFVGPGFGLTNIPNSATTATPLNSNNTIVARDQFGGFSAGQIQALNFAGPGFGLTNIPNTATTATASNVNDTIVARDQFGGFSAGQIQAFNFVGPGFGLTNIPNSATTATPSNTGNTIVARDQFGGFSASLVQAFNFAGGGFGLTNIPNSATTATSANTPNAIVARDQSGSAYIGNVTTDLLLVNQQVFTKGSADFSTASSTAPVKVTTMANAPQTCAANTSLLIESDAPAGQQLFICNAAGNGWNLLGDGTAGGVISVGSADSSIAIGGTTSAPTIEVANGGITSAKLAPNAVTAVNIADGSLAPTKITGTAATLRANTFTDVQSMPGLNVQGQAVVGGVLSAGSISTSVGGHLFGLTNISSGGGTALAVSGGDSTAPLMTATSFFSHAIDATSTNSFGVFANSKNTFGLHAEGFLGGIDALSGFGGTAIQATGSGDVATGIRATVTGNQSIAGLFVNTHVDGPSEIISAGTGTGSANEVFSVDTQGNVFAGGSQIRQFTNSPAGTLNAGLVKLDANGQVLSTAPGDTGGVVGVVVGFGGTSGPVRVAYAGTAYCVFDNTPRTLDYVQISGTKAGLCTDTGPSYPSSGQVIGRVWQAFPAAFAATVLLSGAEQRGVPGGTITSINTGSGLVGGPITSSGTVSIANAGVTNTMLQNSSLTVNPGAGIGGGGTVPLGGVLTLNNTGVLSFNGRTGNILPAPGDYSFSQLGGTVTPGQLPAGVVFNNASNTFTSNQTINGSLSVIDSAPSGGSGFSAVSQNNPAAVFTSNGPTILVAGNAVRGVFNLDSAGNLNIAGTVTGTSFSGDGSALTNVNASSVGGVAGANLATTSALNTETAARQSADTTLQNNIGSEAASRQSADLALQTSISAETTTRQSDTSNLQASINNVSAAAAKLAASNAFTAGTQDFSAAGATLPVRALPSAQTPASCVASKELLIKTDAAAGQQLFICDASGTTWNLVGDGASGGVTSFNGRNGSVSPSSGDYSFSQISGSIAGSQLPALTGDVISAAGSTVTMLAPSGVTSGSYTKLTVDSKGRATSGGQAGFADLAGSLSAAQMPALTGDVTSPAGSATTTLASTGVSAGTYTKLTVDSKGRATTGSQAAFADLVGSAGQNQLPANVVYNNQANTFSTDQTVNGTVKAVSFSGSGAFLTSVNAAMFNGLGPDNFAQMNTANSFSKKQTMVGGSSSQAAMNIMPGPTPASPVIGDVWNTGTTIQYVDNSSNTLSLVATPQSGGMQMLKLTASLTPTNVTAQTCSEQTFTVSGVNSSDVILGVQLATHSPGTNIAIGGWRVSAANAVAIQFCNVSRNNSTPAAGTYTLALMR